MNKISQFRTELMGVSILWIMFFHSEINIPGILSPVEFIKNTGYAGVDVFFLLSGLGLSFSIAKNNSLKKFYSNRFIRILPTFWICLIFHNVLQLIAGEINTTTIFLSFFGLDFILLGRLYLWFIPSIIICYIIFPFFYNTAIKYNQHLVFVLCSALCLLISFIVTNTPLRFILIFTIRIPVFLFGVYIGLLITKKKKKEINILSNLYLNIFLLLSTTIWLFITLSVTTNNFRWSTGAWWYPTMIMAFPFSMIFSILLSKVQQITPLTTNVLKLFGKYSLELYLIHSLVFKLEHVIPFNQNFINILRIPEFLAYTLLSLALSIILQKWIKLLLVPILKLDKRYG